MQSLESACAREIALYECEVCSVKQTTKKREDISIMGREQMRNLEISKIGAHQVNEFEYQKHQGEMTEEEHHDEQRGGTKRLTKAEQVAQVMAAAHKKVEKRKKKVGTRSGLKKGSAAKGKAKK
jgi:hypothetical protein